MRLRLLITASFLTCLLALSGDVLGQVPEGIQVSFVNSADVEVLVGSVSTLVFTVSSTGPYPKVLTPLVELPLGWRAVSELAPIEVTGSEPAVGFLTVRIPESASAGSYPVGLGFSDQENAGLSAQTSLRMLVPAVSSIDLSITSPTVYVRAGDPVQIPIFVRNEGNGPTAIHIDATGPIKTEMRLDSTRVQLGAQTARVVNLNISTSDAVAQETIQEIYIHARGERDPSTFSSVTVRLHIIPAYGQLNKRLKTQPLQLSLQSVGDESGGAAQVGAKSRFRALGGVMDLNMMLADRQRTPMFGSRETYGFSYTSNSLVLRLGDQTQYLSPLSTNGDYGSGVGLEIKKDRFNVKGFAQRSRHQFPSQSVAGGSIGYRPGRAVGLSLNAISRDGPYAGSLVTARGQLNPFGPSLDLEFECGVDQEAGLESPSCSAILGGSLGGLTYNGTLSSMSETYPGYQRGLNRRHARLSYRLPFGLSVEGSIRSQDASYLGTSTRLTEVRQLGGTLNLQFGQVRSYSRLFYIARSWDYTSGELFIDRAETTLRMQQGINAGRIDLHGTIDLGQGESSARSYSGPGHRYQASARYTPSRGFSLSATGEVANGFLNGSTRSTDRRMVNVQARAKLGALTDLSLTYYHNVIQSATTLRYSSYRGTLRRKFRNGQEIKMQTQVNVIPSSNLARTADYQLSYSFPLNVPVGRHSNQVALVGRVYDAVSGEGMAGVLLFLGPNATISDEDGRFDILRPADHSAFLNLDYRAIGFDSVPLIPMPYEVAPGTEQGMLEIPIARSARVQGNIAVFGSATGALLVGDAGNPQVSLSGLGNVVLSLSNSVKEYRTRTSATGNYQFRSVVPGDYLMRVVVHPRLANHRFETDSLRVQVAGGETFEADLRVLPNRPKIRLMNPDSRDIILAPVAVKEIVPAPRERRERNRETLLERPGATPTWSDGPLSTFSIGVPAESNAAADQINRQLDGTLPSKVLPRLIRTTDSQTAKALPSEGIVNLLNRNGLAATPAILSEFRRMNAATLNGPDGLRPGREYRLPIGQEDLRHRYELMLGQFSNYNEAARALRGLLDELPAGAYVMNPDSRDVTPEPVPMKENVPAPRERSEPEQASLLETPDTTPAWSDSPVRTFSIGIHVESDAAAYQISRRLDGTLPSKVQPRPVRTTDSPKARALQSEGLVNLLNRNGLAATPEILSDFRTLNAGTLNGSDGLRPGREYRLPIGQVEPVRRYELMLGQYANYNEAARALRGLLDELPAGAYVMNPASGDIIQEPAPVKTPDTTPTWSDSPVRTFSIGVPVESEMAANQISRQLGGTLPSTVLPRPIRTTDTQTARAMPGEGIVNLLNRNGLAARTPGLLEFREMNAETLNGGDELRPGHEYRLPVGQMDLGHRYELMLGQFTNYNDAARALRSLRRKLPTATFIVETK